MAAAGYLLACMPAQHADHVIGAESLADSHHTRQNLASKDDGLRRGLELVETVVAGAAAGLGVTIAEVLGQVPVTAADARRVALHLAKQYDRRVRELAVLFEHQAPLHE